MIIRLYATAVVLRFEPGWWQVLGSLCCPGRAPEPCAAHHPVPFPAVQAAGFGLGFFPYFFLPCIFRGCPAGNLEPLLLTWPGNATSESEWELFCIPVSSALSPTSLLPCFKFFSPTLRELTLLVNQGVIYFWLHLEIKYHLSYSL